VAIIVQIIDMLFRILSFLVIANILLSYFMDPYHPVRRWVDGIVEPLLAPIRRVIPPLGMIDLSPLILILILQLVSILMRSILL
jgi:YggT family protein